MGLQDPQKAQVDVPLSTFAQQYANAEFIADAVCPRVDVVEQSGTYWKFGRENLETLDNDDVRAPGAAAAEIKRTIADDKFYCPDHAVSDLVPDEERANRPTGLGPEEWSTGFQMDILMGRHEGRVASLLTTAANYPTGHKVALAGNDQWSSTDAASDPIEDIEVGKEAVVKAIGFEPNTLILGRQVLTQLKKHAKITGALRTDRTKVVTVQDLEDLFEIRIQVGKAVKRAAGANSFIWGKHAVLSYVRDAPSPMDLTLAKTFVWVTAPGTVRGLQVQRSRAVPASRKADELDTHFYHDEKVTSSESGYLIENAVA